MRIWGYVLLILGTLFLVLFGIAQMGGAHLGVLPFIISFMVIVIGSGLRNSGKGILQSKPPVAADHSTSPAAGQPAAAPAEQFSTVELQLTPEIAAAIARQTARLNRNLFYVVAAVLVLFVGLGALIGATDKTPGEGATFMIGLGGIGVLSAILIYGISWLTTQRPVRRDLRGTTYLRTTGPIEVVRISSGAMLRLADRAFLMNGRGGMIELSKLNRGTVDYTPHGHVILAARDAEGRSVYCLPGYNA
ncbi:MAG TPA: hypothetical protein VLV89_00665 [Candidatus Acidoferrum sp.]|nr:hypothetical protein [Candidatus Acidoferrum sp.]